MNDLICDKLKEIANWQDIIKKKKIEKFIILVNILCVLFF